jgi:glutaredoxin
MILVELYSKPDCHLCDIAKEALRKIQETHPFELSLITIREGDRNFEEFGNRVPVVTINGKFAFQYRIPEKEFVRRLVQISALESS